MEEQRLLAVVNKWENVDRSKAADALKQLDKVWPPLEAVHASAHHGALPLLTTARAPVPHRFGLNWKPPRRSWLPNREGPS